jgi:hypothetical protein
MLLEDGEPRLESEFVGLVPATTMCSRTKDGSFRFYERILLGPAAWTP